MPTTTTPAPHRGVSDEDRVSVRPILPATAEVAAVLDGRLLLTVPQAARVLGVSRSLMYELMERGEITSIHVGRLRRAPASSLIDYVRRCPRA